MNGLNEYQIEQLDALRQVRRGLTNMAGEVLKQLQRNVQPYLEFRHKVDRFLANHMGAFCTQACFESHTSACCSKDGIITFWADMVINALESAEKELDCLEQAIQHPGDAKKCIYLGPKGCLWKVRPQVCAMFVCADIQRDVLDKSQALLSEWTRYRRLAKGFRWPDKHVLFDQLEELFMEMGCRSPIMYINTSPGLLRVKRAAGPSRQVR